VSRVLVVGHACVDLITRLTRRPGDDEKVEAEVAWFGGGGPGANAAVTLRRLGHDVSLGARLGLDTAGEIAERELVEEGVRCLAPRVEGRTSLAQIQVVGHERSIAWKRGDTAPLDPEDGELDTWLDDVDLLYVDGHEPECAHRAVRRAVDRSIPIVADLGTLREGTDEWLPHLVWAVASERFARAFAASEDPDAWLEALAAAAPRAVGVGVTLGGRGGIARVGDRRADWGPRKVRVRDTTAAGDAFHAGLADAYLHGLDAEASLQWAAAVGASVCRDLGGRQMLPRDRARMQDFERAWPELDPDR
jgi:sugar/nucleoside kinase (ribokinase family)